MTTRTALSQERIIEAAVRVADGGGLAELSMRNVGKELGVEAMSLYHHVANKDELLDGLADWIFTQIQLPALDQPWREAMTSRAASARTALFRHPWTLGLIESRRAAGPALLRHHDAVLGCLRNNGFPVPLAAHAFSATDAYVYGFVLTELNLPFDPAEGVDEMVGEMQESNPMDDYPYLAELITEHVVGREYSYADEFDFGLTLILDGLEEQLVAATLGSSRQTKAAELDVAQPKD